MIKRGDRVSFSLKPISESLERDFDGNDPVQACILIDLKRFRPRSAERQSPSQKSESDLSGISQRFANRS
jgi:hypothetical protein